MPPILFAAADSQGQANFETGHAPTAIAMTVPLAFFLAASTYAVAVNFVPAYRDVADKFGDAKIGIENTGANDVENGTGGVMAEDANVATKGDSEGQVEKAEVVSEK